MHTHSMAATTSSRDALRRLNYDFNSELRLYNTQTGGPFEFVDQAHYEELADAVADYIQEVMREDYGMIEIEFPFQEHFDEYEESIMEDSGEEIAERVSCPIYASSNYNEAEIVLILLCGSGRVASGQWARKLCINDSLQTGSVLPFLDWAKENSFGVIVLNPNKNTAETRKGLCRIPYNENSEAHVEYAWQALCRNLPTKHFALVAHSFGGVSTMNLLEQHGDEVLKRLRCIAFTDSAHSHLSINAMDWSPRVEEFLSKHCINWASSSKPLDMILEMPRRKHANDQGTLDIEGDNDECWRLEVDESHEDRTCPSVSSCNSDDYGAEKCNSVGSEQSSKKRFRKEQKKRTSDWFEARSSSLCTVVSAGTNLHELTTMTAFSSICNFILDSLRVGGVALQMPVQKEKT